MQKQATPTVTAGPRFFRNLFPAVLLLAAALAVYSGGFGNGFLTNWDDPDYITANPDVQAITIANLGRIFTTFYVNNYAPVQMLSYLFDYALWGERPLAFLLANVCLHGLNGFLFFRILCRLRLSPGWSFSAALLFTAHPVQVESVAWISQRKNVLAMTFFLASFRAYLVFAEAETKRWRSYVTTLLWFVLALLTKSVTVILPAVLLAYDFTLREVRGRLTMIVAEKAPFLVIAAGGAWLAIISQGGDELRGLAQGFHGGSGFATALTMLTVYKGYLFNLFWPLQLSAVYQVDIKKVIDAEVFTCLVLLAISLGIPWLAVGKARRDLAFWLAVFFIGFLPVAQIVPIVTLMNDRYLYFPMLGFAAILALLLQTVIEHRPRLFGPVVVASAAVLLVLAVIAWQRAGVWASSLTLWQDAVAKAPGSAQAWRNLGNARDHLGMHREAIAPYQRAVDIDQADFETWYNLGTNHLVLEDWPAAIAAYRQSLELAPGRFACRQNLALVYTLAGRHAEAIWTLSAMVDKSDDPAMQLLLAANHYAMGDLGTAGKIYEKVRRGDIQTGFGPVATGLLSLVALRQGEREAADRLWQEAIHGARESDLYFEMARLEALGCRREESLAYLDRAVRLGLANRAAIAADPAFARLRRDVRFLPLIGR